LKLCEWCFTNGAGEWVDVGGGRLHVCLSCSRRCSGYRLTADAVAGVREGAGRREVELSFLGSRLA
jgi:hypothetical protein